jgi:CDP-diacylglycerol--glycerol-3-phosphate 3-phosphatidyltransferase
VTPNVLTAAGVSLCLAAAVLVPFENREHLALLLARSRLFVVGSLLDILDGALARAGGKSTPFGAFIDSTTDRVGEGAMLAAIALVFARHGNDWAVVSRSRGRRLVPRLVTARPRRGARPEGRRRPRLRAPSALS